MGRFIFSNYHYTHIVSIFYDYSRYSTRKSLINSLILKKDSLIVLLLKVKKVLLISCLLKNVEKNADKMTYRSR